MNTNPFVTVGLGRKMTKEELVRAIRQDIVIEQESVILYEAHVQATNDPSTQAIFNYIIDDEKEHTAMLQALLERLDNDQALLTVKGRNHSEELFTNRLMDEAIEVAPDAMIAPSEPFATEGDAEFPGGSFIAAEPFKEDDEGFARDMIHGGASDPANLDYIDDAGSVGGTKGKGMI